MSTSTMEKKVTLVDDRVRFESALTKNADIHVDSDAPIGHGDGATPLELFLISISSCFGMAVTSLLRDRVRRSVTSASVTAQGVVREDHPRAFSRISMHIEISSPGLTEEELQRVIEAAENKICPIMAMVRGNVEVQNTYTLAK